MGIHPAYRKAKRRAIIVGWSAIIVGCSGLVMPMVPGLLLILLGLSLLSLHSKNAHQFAAMIRARYPEVGTRMEHLETGLMNALDISTHSHEYVHIPRNGNGELHALIEVAKQQAGVAVLLHSARTTMEGGVQNSVAEAFRARGFTVVRFDAFNGMGESTGVFTNLTASNYREDLASVMAWIQDQPWHTEQVALVGHSVGGLVAALYATEHPEQVLELFLLAPTVSGAQYREAAKAADEEGFLAWEATKLKLVPHPLTKEDMGLGFTFVMDLDAYDLLPLASQINCPTHVLVGSKDTVSPPDVCMQLVQTIGAHAQLHTLKDVPHIPTTREHIRSVEQILEVID